MHRGSRPLALYACGRLVACVAPPQPTVEPSSPWRVPPESDLGATATARCPRLQRQRWLVSRARAASWAVAVRLDGTPMKGITVYAAFIEMRDDVRLSGEILTGCAFNHRLPGPFLSA